jgi:hypothetical protein
MKFDVGQQVRYNGNWKDFQGADIYGLIERIVTEDIYPMYVVRWYDQKTHEYKSQTRNPPYDLLPELQVHRNNVLNELLK